MSDRAPDHFSQAYWDERYSSSTRVWSGRPNPHLVTYAADLPPGRAVDIGSGEGADAMWLASRGWHVTCLDVSPVALDKAAARAQAEGVADRMTWQRADMLTWAAGPGTYDLVSAQFMHLPRSVLPRLHRELAAAVAPGGTLLVVGHHPDDVRHRHGDQADVRFTAEEVAAVLEADAWSVIEALTVERDHVDSQGQTGTATDAVLRAERRS